MELACFSCLGIQVVLVLTEAGQPPPLPVDETALGTQVPEQVVVCPDSEGSGST